MNKRFFSNTIWLVGGQIIKTIITFVISIFTARFLGPSDYGIIGYVTTFITVLTSVANLGLGNIIVKEFVSKKNESQDILRTAIFMQLISSSIAYIVVILSIFLLNIDNTLMLVCASLQSLSLIFGSFEAINYYYQSQLRSKITTIINLVVYVVVQVYKVILLIMRASVILFAFALALETILVGVSLFIAFKTEKKPRGRFIKELSLKLFKESSPFILVGIIGALYSSIDRIMLKQFFQSTEPVGYYTVAYNLSHSWSFVISALLASFTPLIYEAHGKDEQLYLLRARQLYCSMFWISFIFCVAVDVVAPLVIPILYKNIYNESIIPTILLTWNIPFAYLGSARGLQFVSEKKQKYLIPLSIMTVILNVIMNFIFIPLWGVAGAALGTIVSEMFICFIGPFMFKKTRNIANNILKGIFFYKVNFKDVILSIKQLIGKKKQPDIKNKNINYCEKEIQNTDK